MLRQRKSVQGGVKDSQKMESSFFDALYVMPPLTNGGHYMTGPVLPKEKSITIGNNKVTVPDRYYKVVYDLTPPQKMIDFIIPNNGSTRPLQDFAVTVDAVEKETGLDFFSLVPRQEQDRLESTITLNAWSW